MIGARSHCKREVKGSADVLVTREQAWACSIIPLVVSCVEAREGLEVLCRDLD